MHHDLDHVVRGLMRAPSPRSVFQPRTAMRNVKPGAEAIAAVTTHLAPPRRTH